MFITFEGIEGSGKSTQAQRLAAALPPPVLLTHEPGATTAGHTIRDLLLSHRSQGMSREAEVLLYFADRAQHVQEVILPALKAGQVAISDRYTDSSLAYQGYGRGMSLESLRKVADLATGGLWPDLTFFLDVGVETSLSRLKKRGGHDRLESETREFYERVREGYLALLAAEPHRWVRVDTTQPLEDVTQHLKAVVHGRLIKKSEALF